MIKKLISNSENTILEVMKTIHSNGKGISFITDNKNKLVGIVTDGDIRQAILNGFELNTKISIIMNKNFIYGNIKESYSSLKTKMSDFVYIIPLLNDTNEIIDYFEFKQNLYFPVAIPNLEGNEFNYLTDAFMSNWISSNGEYIHRFEKAFSEYSNCKFGLTCSNGTAAIHLALMALDIKEDDEVIIPDLTFAATINTILYVNAKPVIVDVEENSWCIDPKKIEQAITKNTKAIIPVHLYGQVCDMTAIMRIAKKYNLKVIEDCAEAHGAMFKEKKVGSIGDIGCFSFYGNKIITTGEGGICITSNKKLLEKMKILRDHGMNPNKRYWHDIIGYNYRMTNLQAAIGLAQLERIEEILTNRKIYEEKYKNILNNKIFTFQQNLQDRKKVTWLVSILLNEQINRDDFITILKKEGIDSRPFFYPLSAMPIYENYCDKDTPIAHKLSKFGINLPTYESLKSLNDISNIFQKLDKFIQS
tara:strand:+ start:39026 stop:40450 length:1425 start_codon:yes stop_codon:yes gene_type:complete